jgi:hypothetical protein
MTACYRRSRRSNVHSKARANVRRWPVAASCNGHDQLEPRQAAIGSTRPIPDDGSDTTLKSAYKVQRPFVQSPTGALRFQNRIPTPAKTPLAQQRPLFRQSIGGPYTGETVGPAYVIASTGAPWQQSALRERQVAVDIRVPHTGQYIHGYPRTVQHAIRACELKYCLFQAEFPCAQGSTKQWIGRL